MIRPTRRAVLLLTACLPVALLPAILGASFWPVWIAALAGCAALLGADAILSLPQQELRVQVSAPKTLYLGEPAEEAKVVLRAPAGWSLRLWALLEVDELLETQPELAVNLVEGAAEAVFALAPRKRGTARIEAVWLRWRGPLQLLQRELRVVENLEIAVAPNVRAVRRTALRFFTNRQFLAGLKVERYVGEGSEFESLREFAPGLDQRTMDWKASARHRILLSREFRAERNHQAVIAIDTGHLMIEPLGGLSRLDHAVNAALLLGYVALRSGDRVGLFGFDERVRCWAAPQGGAHSFPRLQQLSAALQHSPAETNFTLGLAELSARLRRRSLIVVLTDFTDTVTAQLMIDNLRLLARRHLMVFVALRNPDIDLLAAAPPRKLDDLYTSVVSGDLLRDRAVVLRKLQRLGIHVVDAVPATVDTELISRYLQIRRREMV
jgi:uncharacterized protein (DUF58 family)